jgi:hypothetical protein
MNDATDGIRAMTDPRSYVASSRPAVTVRRVRRKWREVSRPEKGESSLARVAPKDEEVIGSANT